MTNELRRFAFLLAASDLTDKQLAALIGELGRSSPKTVIRLVRRLRTINEAVLETNQIVRTANPLARDYGTGSENVAREIERLLRLDARMSIAEAMTNLSESLSREEKIPSDVRHVPSKSSSDQFRRWVLRILEYVSASTLLHHATALRNKHVHVSDTDWPLREGD
jgi:hypothetical protein